MSLDPHNVQKIFSQAIEITDPQQRLAFLVERCAGDAELFRRVSELLTAFDQPKQYLDQPTVIPDEGPDADRKGQQPGSIIAGRYKLLEAIAEGGMGTVWVAEQTKPVRRKVAIKLIKPGMDSRQVLARFDAERQALALMDHPNIAKVFDGGVTDQGRPYFAMEYVKGRPLTEYCDQVRLSVEERLKLFVPICQAVQHAHPKVIDFGLAKAMHQPLTEQTLHTGHGLMLGTPLYMSPEQAEHNNLDVDTRSDVYSLGVMLYELLTGTTPLEKAQLKDAVFGEILRLIKEVEPPKPSTRVSTNAQRASIAAQRSLDPEQLGRSIRGDLDWIIMKALDKERDRRYETANGLARDIERFLSHEAVEACPPSTIYRLQTIPNAIGTLLSRARFAANGRSVFGGYEPINAFGGSVPLTETGTLPPQGSVRPEGFVVYDPNSEPRTWTYPADTFSHISFLDISGDGRFVGALGNDVTHVHGQPACRLRVWNVETQELVLDHLENRRLNRFVFNRDGSRIAAYYCHGPLSYSNELRDVVVALDVAEGKVLGVARHNDDIDAANWLPDGQRLILTALSFSGNQQKEMLSWELDAEQPRKLSGELMPNFVITAMSPDGGMIAVSSHSTSSIRLIDTTTGFLIRTLHNEASNIESMDFSPDATQLTAFCASGDVVQWTIVLDDDRFALRSQPLPPTSRSSQSAVRWTFS